MWKVLFSFGMVGTLAFILANAYASRSQIVPFSADDYKANKLEIKQSGFNQKLVEIGRQLFHDKRLSANEEIACASCHHAQNAFGDSKSFSNGIAPTKVNTPPLFNLKYYKHFFWDGRVGDLVQQIKEPLFNSDEHGADTNIINAVVENFYLESYQAFQTDFDQDITSTDFISLAIASFLNRLESFNSPFDKFIAQYEAQNLQFVEGFGPEEWQGFQVFLSKGRCVSCHSGALFSDQKFYITGMAFEDRTDRLLVSGNQCNSPRCIAANSGVRTPTLRNLSQTAPYFHDGSAATIKEVIYRYMRPAPKKNRHKDITPLYLNSDEVVSLEKFLLSLNGTVEQND